MAFKVYAAMFAATDIVLSFLSHYYPEDYFFLFPAAASLAIFLEPYFSRPMTAASADGSEIFFCEANDFFRLLKRCPLPSFGFPGMGGSP